MNLEDETDEALGLRVAIEAPQGSAHPLFQELYRRHAATTERFIAARVRWSQVADIHQETWSKAWKRASRFTVGTGYRAWLLTIASNTITDEYRAAARKPTLALMDEGNLVDDDRNAAAFVVAGEEQEILKNCLQHLTPVALDLVRGRLGGRSYAELCEELKLSESAAHKLFSKSKAQLRQCVEQKMS